MMTSVEETIRDHGNSARLRRKGPTYDIAET